MASGQHFFRNFLQENLPEDTILENYIFDSEIAIAFYSIPHLLSHMDR
jgi:hypothetical protein